jgi:hypothetical protein
MIAITTRSSISVKKRLSGIEDAQGKEDVLFGVDRVSLIVLENFVSQSFCSLFMEQCHPAITNFMMNFPVFSACNILLVY